jgi:hypothetical protein
MPRSLAVLAASALLALVGAAAARADGSGDAGATADAFVTALVAGDAESVCGMLSADLLARIGSQRGCLLVFAARRRPRSGTTARAPSCARPIESPGRPVHSIRSTSSPCRLRAWPT